MNSLSTIETVAKILAILIGGVWVYFKTIRARTFIPRLQPEISVKLLRQNGVQYLIASIQVKNVGSSIAVIKEEGSALIVNCLNCLPAQMPMGLISTRRTAFTVFDLENEPERVIEPGSVIYSQEIITVPNHEFDAFRLEFSVSAGRGVLSWKNRKWRAFATILNEEAEVVKLDQGERK